MSEHGLAHQLSGHAGVDKSSSRGLFVAHRFLKYACQLVHVFTGKDLTERKAGDIAPTEQLFVSGIDG